MITTPTPKASTNKFQILVVDDWTFFESPATNVHKQQQKNTIAKTINDPKCKYPIKFSKNKISVQGSNKDFSSWKNKKQGITSSKNKKDNIISLDNNKKQKILFQKNPQKPSKQICRKKHRFFRLPMSST